jgi:predicted DNA-binding protein
MGQNKNFIAARLPQELYDRLESTAGDKKGEKTQIIIRAIAAYLEFPLKSTDTAADNSEKFVALENRIAELEQQFQEFKALVISDNLIDNTIKVPVIATDSAIDSSDNNVQHDIAIDNKNDNKSTVPIQSDGTLGPVAESHMADFIGISRNTLSYHRKNLEKTGKPLNHPKRAEYNSKPYDLICLGESKNSGKTKILWIAKPVIELDNTVYQPDIIQYQPDNNLNNVLQEINQEEQKQDSESPEPVDNDCNQKLSAQLNTKQEDGEQDSQIPKATDNISYQTLSPQSDVNEELNEELQDSGKQLTTQQQSELPGEEQPEF